MQNEQNNSNSSIYNFGEKIKTKQAHEENQFTHSRNQS